MQQKYYVDFNHSIRVIQYPLVRSASEFLLVLKQLIEDYFNEILLPI